MPSKKKGFQIIPGVGKSIETDLIDLGYREVSDLIDENPVEMYKRLMTLRGTYIDRCILYVFKCAVYFASEEKHDKDLLKWWNWKDDNIK